MLKKLKKKFILINMALVSAVLMAVLMIGLVSSYQMKRSELDRSLDKVLEMTAGHSGRGDKDHTRPGDGDLADGQMPAPIPEDGGFTTDQGPFPGGHQWNGNNNDNNMLPEFGKDEMPQIYAFAVSIDRSGEIKNTFAMNADMDDSIVSEAVSAALGSGSDSGTLSQLGLVYKVQHSAEWARIAFTSVSNIRNSMLQTAGLYLLIFVVGSLLLLGVSFFLSGIALKPAEDAWNSQKQFVADASHDLKTPLTVILANNNILKSHAGETVESQMKWIESTDEEAVHMKGLAEKLLELSGAEMLGDAVELSPVDLSDLIDGIAMQLEAVAFESGVELESSIDGEITVKTNSDAVCRIAHILIDNAIKYSPKGGCAVVELKKEKNGVRFSVKTPDTVISEEDLPHIFERFYRADKVRNVGGHGLGLAIAKSLSESIKSELKAFSDPGNGTEFRLVIPQKLVD